MTKNILIITFDQCRADWLNVYKQKTSIPNINELAKNSLIANNCYSPSPHCVPTRFSWLTGLSPCELGVTKNVGTSITEKADTIFKKKRDENIYVSLIGKTHWTSHFKEDDLRNNKELFSHLGFDDVQEIAGPRALQRIVCDLTDEWEKRGCLEIYKQDMKRRYKSKNPKEAWSCRPSILPNSLYPDLWITEKAIKKIKELPENNRWILWVSYVGPHEPFDTPEPWSSNKYLYHGDEIKHKPEWISDLCCCELERTNNKWSGKLSREEIYAIRDDYASKISMLDDCVGKLMEHVEMRTDSVKTEIIVTSDHGEHLGDYGFLYKGSFLESSVKVPFIYRPCEDQRYKTTKFLNSYIDSTLLLKKIVGNQKTNHRVRKAELTQAFGVISSFGDENMYIQDGVKIVLNKEGQIIWGNDLKSRGEKENIVKDLQSSGDRRYKLAVEWAKEQLMEQKKLLRRKTWFNPD